MSKQMKYRYLKAERQREMLVERLTKLEEYRFNLTLDLAQGESIEDTETIEQTTKALENIDKQREALEAEIFGLAAEEPEVEPGTDEA